MLEEQEFEHVDAEEIDKDDIKDIEDKIVFTDEKKLFQFYEKLRCHCTQSAGKKTGKIGKEVTELLLFLPDFFMLTVRLFIDKRTPRRVKVILGGVIAYLLMPWDIIPDFIPIIGYVDDLVLVVIALNSMLNEIEPEVVLDNWSGKEKPLTIIQQVIAVTEKFLSKNILVKIKKIVTTLLSENEKR